MMEAVRTSETSVDNHFTWQYIPEDNSEHHIRRRENLKSHNLSLHLYILPLQDRNPTMNKKHLLKSQAAHRNQC
jgi:hypothetical protein